MPKLLAVLLAVVLPFAAPAESAMHAGELAHALDRLGTTPRVLYVAAHPDDENTRLLAWLANQRHVQAAYLSLTRGGGGQNLIGTEQGELLDVVRTEELLAARGLDGALQRFSRMRDFGFSKSPEETLAIWGHDEALADVVRVIRAFQPDLIVTRFDEVSRPNHGHHVASAILAREAFAAAADPAAFPEQLREGLQPWAAARLLHNESHWRGPPPADALPLDVGAFDPRLGMGYGELAALSRSQHKSQGFGAAGERGQLLEHFSHVAGSRPEKDILEGIEPGWARFGAAGKKVAQAIDAARAALGVGATIALRHVERNDTELAALGRRLSAELQGAPNVHVYWSPPGGGSFGWHCDPEEVFLLQVRGRKRYRFRANTRHPWPLAKAMGAAGSAANERGPIESCVLEAGGWLYLPAGWWHETQAESESLAISVGLLAPSPIDLVEHLLAELARDPRWRARMPAPGLALPGTDQEKLDAWREILAAMAGELAERLRDDRLPQRYLLRHAVAPRPLGPAGAGSRRSEAR